MDDVMEKTTMRKIYMRLLPFAFIAYSLCYVDRINATFAGLTMRGDLHMSAAAYGFAVGTFYWGYFIFEVPSNIVMEKVGARVWIHDEDANAQLHEGMDAQLWIEPSRLRLLPVAGR